MASKSDIQLAEAKMQNESDREIARNNYELRLILEENHNSQRT